MLYMDIIVKGVLFMRNVIVILSVFVILIVAPLNTTTLVANAGVNVTAVLVCHFKTNSTTYRVVLAELGDEGCSLPSPACDSNATCTDCLQALDEDGFSINISNEVTNNRVVYILHKYGSCS